MLSHHGALGRQSWMAQLGMLQKPASPAQPANVRNAPLPHAPCCTGQPHGMWVGA